MKITVSIIYFETSEFSSKEKRRVHILGIILLLVINNLEVKNFFSVTDFIFSFLISL